MDLSKYVLVLSNIWKVKWKKISFLNFRFKRLIPRIDHLFFHCICFNCNKSFIIAFSFQKMSNVNNKINQKTARVWAMGIWITNLMWKCVFIVPWNGSKCDKKSEIKLNYWNNNKKHLNAQQYKFSWLEILTPRASIKYFFIFVSNFQWNVP